MSLLELKAYLQSVKTANLLQLSQHFQRDPATIEAMLQHWIQKGKVIHQTKPPVCGKTCFQCPKYTTEIYQWKE